MGQQQGKKSPVEESGDESIVSEEPSDTIVQALIQEDDIEHHDDIADGGKYKKMGRTLPDYILMFNF